MEPVLPVSVAATTASSVTILWLLGPRTVAGGVMMVTEGRLVLFHPHQHDPWVTTTKRWPLSQVKNREMIAVSCRCRLPSSS